MQEERLTADLKKELRELQRKCEELDMIQQTLSFLVSACNLPLSDFKVERDELNLDSERLKKDCHKLNGEREELAFALSVAKTSKELEKLDDMEDELKMANEGGESDYDFILYDGDILMGS